MELEPEPNMEREKRGARAKYGEKKGEPEPKLNDLSSATLLRTPVLFTITSSLVKFPVL